MCSSLLLLFYNGKKKQNLCRHSYFFHNVFSVQEQFKRKAKMHYLTFSLLVSSQTTQFCPLTFSLHDKWRRYDYIIILIFLCNYVSIQAKRWLNIQVTKMVQGLHNNRMAHSIVYIIRISDHPVNYKFILHFFYCNVNDQYSLPFAYLYIFHMYIENILFLVTLLVSLYYTKLNIFHNNIQLLLLHKY